MGLKFKAARIDPIRVRIDSGRWRFRIRPRLFWGFALMSLDRVRRVRRRLIFFVAGGPVASLVCGTAALIAGEIGVARYYDSPWPTFLEFLGAWSFFIGAVALFPFKVRRWSNDGMLLRALLCRKPEATHLIASYALSTITQESLFPPDYFGRWFRLAAETELDSENYYANWLAYQNAQDPGVAAQFLERILADSALMDGDQRDRLILEAAVFTGWRRNDFAKAELWFKRTRSLDRIHPVWLARVRVALLCAQSQFEVATVELDRALSLIQKSPDGFERRRCEGEWLAWREQIQKRVLV